MRRVDVGDLDPLRDGVASGDGGIARVQRRVVDTLALRLVAGAEAVAGEPVIAVAGLAGRAVGIVPAGLAIDFGTVERAGLEAVFRGLLFGIGWEVAGSQELVDEVLVFADAIAEHATMVAVVVNAPLHFNDISCSVCYYGRVTPVGRGLVIVYADASIVTTGTAPSYWSRGEIRPG